MKRAGRTTGAAVTGTLAVATALLVNALSPARPTPDGVPTTAAILAAASAPATTTTVADAGPEPAGVDPAAADLLARVGAYYARPVPLAVAGTLVGTFDVAGRRRVFTLDVVGRTDGHGRYRHDAKGVGLLVSDGHAAYLYDAQRDSYARLPADAERVPPERVPPSVVSVLLDENPALLLTLTDDPALLLRRAASATVRPATRPATAAPATTDPTAGLVLARDGKTVTLWADAVTGELRGGVIDYGPVLRDRKTNGVRSAVVTLDYRPATRPAAFAADDAAFTWTPPATATDFTLSDELVRPRAATRPGTAPATGPSAD